MEWAVVSVVVILALTVNSDAMSVDSSIDNLRRILTENFSVNRHHDANPAGKNAARAFLAATFKSYGLEIVLQRFPTEVSEYPGENIIGTLPGRYTGTPLDRPVVLGAHYDTELNTPGVNDNGSGQTVLVEAARIITSQPCQPDNTVMFVSFDFEEYGEVGSRAFVRDVLLPYLNDSGIPLGNFQGAISVDGVLNYNTSEGSQLVPPQIQMLPGQLNWYNFVADGGFRGNFIGIIGRQDHDSHLYDPFLAAWNNATGSTAYRIVPMFLPFRDVYQEGPSDPFWPIYGEFLRSDHASFWKENPDLKAVDITDTGEFRGMMQQCYHRECDNIQSVTEEQWGFLKKTTDAVAGTVLTLAGTRDDCTDATSAAPPSGSFAPQSATVASFLIAAMVISVMG